MKMGADNETKRIFKETNFWLDNESWTDPNDGFDYGAALNKIAVPPILSLTGVADKVLGHPSDCLNLLKEANSVKGVFSPYWQGIRQQTRLRPYQSFNPQGRFKRSFYWNRGVDAKRFVK
jgi:hypothetical protein